uniref:Uncharacterized protein n=1 Tax=Pithovirus LCPAC102 TaxID=2506587 RepID=A0A4D5XF89_9VIRU|nr:MAG: hypothetical protein LCPAC102_01830 [Pithovirus LCPAC102]
MVDNSAIIVLQTKYKEIPIYRTIYSSLGLEQFTYSYVLSNKGIITENKVYYDENVALYIANTKHQSIKTRYGVLMVRHNIDIDD